MRRRERERGIGPAMELEERSRDWRLVQLERKGEREPRREREESESLKTRPLLQVMPWR